MAAATIKSPNPTDVYVGARLRMRRLVLGLSQEKLADQIGLTFQQIQKYEKGKNRIGASRLQQIGQALQVPVSFFFDGGPTAVKTKAASGSDDMLMITKFISSSDGVTTALAFTKIKDAKVRRALVGLIEAVAAS